MSDLGDFKGKITADTLPLITNRLPEKLEHFNIDEYNNNLYTKILGQVVLYVDIVPTTMSLLDGFVESV